MEIPRVYHPVSHWEECNYNMWGDCDDRQKAIRSAIAFTGDHELYGHYMRRVIREWPISCENALTDRFLNRKAWIGHAAAALWGRIPEDVTREAWRHLSHEQQLLANNQAREAIREWEDSYRKGHGLCENMAGEVLPLWHTGPSSNEASRNREGPELS